MEIMIFCLAVACLILIAVTYLADRGRRAAEQAHAETINTFRESAIVQRSHWYELGYKQAQEDAAE